MLAFAEEGLVAAPIFGARRDCAAARSISGPLARFHGDDLDALKRHVRKASEEISTKVGQGGARER
jgi:DNA-binding IclR family transcriptional regulator